jgi:hypothetical protein
MSKVGQKFSIMFLLSIAAAALIVVGRLGLGVLLPTWFTLPMVWLPEDLWDGLLYETLAEVVDSIPGLGLCAVMLAFSFWLRPDELPVGSSKGIPASAALVSISLLAILTAGIVALLVLFVQPWLGAKTDAISFRQVQARQLESAYLDLKKAGLTTSDPLDVEARLSLIQRLGTLRPKQNSYAGSERLDYDFELQIIKTHLDMEEFFRLRLLPGVEKAFSETEATVADLLTRSRAELEGGANDAEFQANLYAYTAYRRMLSSIDHGLKVSEEDWAQVRELIDASWSKIRERTLLTDERLKASYFFRKGKSLGDYNFQNYIEAYYGFQELHAEDPNDAEVDRYWKLSLEALRDSVLFRQEMDVLFHVPGSENLVFLNSSVPREVVRIGKLLDTAHGVYVKDFEFFRFSVAGKPLLHWKAPYGRWSDKGVEFQVWEKDKAMPDFPQVFIETPENLYDTTSGEPMQVDDLASPPRFVPNLTVRDLQVISANQPGPQTLETWGLLTEGQTIAALGYTSIPLQSEFVSRLVSPLGYFAVFLLVFAFSWHFRAKESRKRWWFMFPILPFVINFVLEFLVWSGRLVAGGLVDVFPLTTAALILFSVLIFMSIIGLVVVYNQLNVATKRFRERR